MNYTLTNDISQATHWLSQQDQTSCVKDFITPDRAYELIKLKDSMDDQEEYFIRSDDNELSMYYLAHKGYFIIGEDN